MKHKQYDILADLLKGIGIISVVIGHSGGFIPTKLGSSVTAFVFLYYLMVFFFVAGMTFHPKKYPDPYVYIGRQLKSTAPLFIGYNLLFLAAHNLFARFHVVDIEPFTKNDFIIQGISIFAFKYTEVLTGALWFVPMFLFARSLFAIGFQHAEKFSCKWISHAVVLLVTGALGLYTSSCGMCLHFALQTALLGIPVIYLGYWFQQNRETLIRFANPLTCLVSMSLLGVFVYMKIGHIDLANNQIISVYWFYPITILGIIFCVSLAESIRSAKWVANVVAHAGSISFHIMALHFAVFKCFDLFVGKFMGIELEARMRFPYTFDRIGWLYTILGIGIPALWVYLLRIARNKFHTK